MEVAARCRGNFVDAQSGETWHVEPAQILISMGANTCTPGAGPFSFPTGANGRSPIHLLAHLAETTFQPQEFRCCSSDVFGNFLFACRCGYPVDSRGHRAACPLRGVRLPRIFIVEHSSSCLPRVTTNVLASSEEQSIVELGLWSWVVQWRDAGPRSSWRPKPGQSRS